MKFRWMSTGFAAGIALSFGASQVLSQDHGHSHDQDSGHSHGHGDHDHGHAHDQDGGHGMDEAGMQDMMAMMQKMGAPGDNHKMLEYFVGDWDATIHMHGMPDSQGSAKTHSLYDGRFIAQEFSGDMMGMPMEGVQVFGFDNYKNKFRAVWIDSVSTTMLVSEGLLDQTGKQLTMYGEMDEYMTGEHDKMVKYIYRIIDEDSYVFEIHDLGIVPGDTKVMAITYNRK